MSQESVVLCISLLNGAFAITLKMVSHLHTVNTFCKADQCDSEISLCVNERYGTRDTHSV